MPTAHDSQARNHAFDGMLRLGRFLIEHHADETLQASVLLNFLYVVAVMDYESVETATRIAKRVDKLRGQLQQLGSKKGVEVLK